MNRIVTIYNKDNRYYVINDDEIIIKRLFRYKINNNFNKRKLKRIINKLDSCSISYRLDGIDKLYDNNKYDLYLDKYKKEIDRNKDIEYICSYLEDNILDMKIKKLLNEIVVIINE